MRAEWPLSDFPLESGQSGYDNIADIRFCGIHPFQKDYFMSKIWVMLLSVSALSACSPGADTKAAEKSIASFHADLNAGNFNKIYYSSSSDLKAATDKDKFTKILNAVHTKLGIFKSGNSVGWNDNVTTGGHFVTISYKASYDKGAAAENFVFRVEEGGSALAGYHVNSDALLLN